MFNIFKQFLDFNEKQLGRFRKRVEEINQLENKVRNLKDKDFVKETTKLKEEIRSGKKKLDEVLPWSFALVREASRRVLNQRHFDVQLMAGMALHEGKIAEQKTGEGKTLSATTALYLNALTEKGVHLVTVNDYLARRDAGWMGAVFEFLGMKTSAIISDASFIYDSSLKNKEVGDDRLVHLKPISRKEAYEADVVYGINSEFGFDYLRDNMAQSPSDIVQRNFYFAIIDEADSVLIDEARTPHIISAPYEEDTSKYYQYATLVRQLDKTQDYVIDEKLRTANLTEKGIENIERTLGVNNIYEKDFDTLFHIEAALKAETLFKADKDYIVREGEVIIVDEFTGRLLQGRRFSEGLHQAIEAKEHVAIQRESKTLATVSLQNYFRMYEKLGGMTGTASTESEEFHKIYKADVIVIPTHRQMVRKDFPDMIYKTEKGKFDAVVEELAQEYKRGRPVLVGTTSIEKNERLSRLLHTRGIPHEVLNAKNHLKEAEIIARAGKKGAVTIATNMAGRGVDIILGGVEEKGGSKKWQKEHDEVVSLGGLYVIGTERHESRRIDNQLRGRSGRQGDPGQTGFFVSLEDDLMRIFGGEQISKLMTFFNFPVDQPLSHPMVSRAIEQAQVKVEGFNFDIRKSLVEFDDVLNKQREIIYTRRKKILSLPEVNPDEFRDTVEEIVDEEVVELTASYSGLGENVGANEMEVFKKDIEVLFPGELKNLAHFIEKKEFEKIGEKLMIHVEEYMKEREKKLKKEFWFDIVRSIFLSTIDQFWTEHLTAIDDLREGVRLRGYAQLDPLIEYKNEAYTMFERLVGNMNFESTRRLLRLQIEAVDNIPTKKEEKPLILQSASRIDPYSKRVEQAHSQTDRPQMQSSQQQSPDIHGFKVIPPGTLNKHKLGRNDPCWCGSGKKYKKCHYPN